MKIEDLPIVSSDTLEDIHRYFQSTKELSPEEFMKWRLLKSSLQTLNEGFDSNSDLSVDRNWNEQLKAAIGVQAVLNSGICNAIYANLIIKS